jgi:hypothetical protein
MNIGEVMLLKPTMLIGAVPLAARVQSGWVAVGLERVQFY